MTTLSNPPEQRRPRYGAIVIGSGYGGSIVAARLAAAGHDVCILERGKEWATGSFPDECEAVVAELRCELNPLGLFDYRTGDDVDVFSGNGLGGTSLINANVAIVPDRRVFGQARWPAAIQDAAAGDELAGYFARAAAMLHVAAPMVAAAELAKHRAHRKAAEKRSGTFIPMSLAVNFDEYDDRPNEYGVHQRRCTMCGDCITGCNVGAKGSLPMSYLPLAKRHGAAIYTRVEVRCVVPAPGGGYHVMVLDRSGEGGASEAILHARVVVLAAGALGSTGLLLASRDRGLRVSRRLGHHFSSNGDQLGLGYNTDEPTDVLGFGNRAWESPPPRVGPSITSAIAYRSETGTRGFLIQEGAIPLGLIAKVRAACLGLGVGGEDTDSGIRDAAREVARVMRDLVGRDEKGALNHSMVYLGIGHDSADGRIVLDHRGRPRVVWGALRGQRYIEEMREEMRGLTAALGGTFIESPRMSKLFGGNPLTVHPLGGCPMGADADGGVVDHAGRVFDPDGAPGAVHAGLYVADAAVIPTSLGVNPFMTISALAERIADHLVRDAAAERLAPSAAAVAPPAVREPPLGLEWTEVMKGHVTRAIIAAGNPGEYRAAEEIGREDGSAIEYRVTVIIDDLDAFIADAEREAIAEGHIDSALFGRGRPIEEGRFNLFVVDPETFHRRLIYRLKFVGEDGRPYLLDGFKDVHDDPGFDVWSDNTTLFTSIRDGWSTADRVIAQGIIHVRLPDFLRQLGTIRIRNSRSAGESATWLGRFGTFYFGEIWDTYIRGHVPVPVPAPAVEDPPPAV